jgi:hypothetical protein
MCNYTTPDSARKRGDEAPPQRHPFSVAGDGSVPVCTSQMQPETMPDFYRTMVGRYVYVCMYACMYGVQAAGKRASKHLHDDLWTGSITSLPSGSSCQPICYADREY